MVIRRTDRVRDVIRREEGLIDVLAGISPALERLRDPQMRQVMSGLLTMEQVAQMAGLDPEVLVARLNAGQGGESKGVGADNPGLEAPSGEEAWPAVLRAIPEQKVVLVDVREDLRAGREPFSRIMSARREVPEGGALCVRATFEPVPLYSVMGRQRFTHHTDRLADDDWRVWVSAGAPPGRPRRVVTRPASNSASTTEFARLPDHD